MEKKRKFLDDYIKFVFTCLIIKGVEKPQYVICSSVLSTASMKPFQLKCHLQTKHPEYADKDVEFFKCNEVGMKRQTRHSQKF